MVYVIRYNGSKYDIDNDGFHTYVNTPEEVGQTIASQYQGNDPQYFDKIWTRQAQLAKEQYTKNLNEHIVKDDNIQKIGQEMLDQIIADKIHYVKPQSVTKKQSTSQNVINCVCGGHYLNNASDRKQHETTKKHQNFMQTH